MAESYRSKDKTLQASNTNKEWILYLRKAYHPLLLQQHRQKLHMARKDVRNATAVSNILLTFAVLNFYFVLKNTG